ncbi:MAG: hypothetical protein MO846_05390 [Candidatus Devosia symbiotica]|nr:hypothetical protein [Candidatus Devosia symbiotica]
MSMGQRDGLERPPGDGLVKGYQMGRIVRSRIKQSKSFMAQQKAVNADKGIGARIGRNHSHQPGANRDGRADLWVELAI